MRWRTVLGFFFTPYAKSHGCFSTCLILLMGCLGTFAHAAGNAWGIRVGTQPHGMRLVLDAPSQLDPSLSWSKDHTELVLSIPPGVAVKRPLPKASGLIKRLTLTAPGLCLLFAKPVKVKQTLKLPPGKDASHHRFVMDISPREGISPKLPKKKILATPFAKDKKVIVIDAGHGGKDPGAQSRGPLCEKDVTLSCAHLLAHMLKKKGTYTVVMTRTKDTFLSLSERVQLSRKHKADIFISIHADSSPNPEARGLSLYTLSKVASDKEAARLAEKENLADLGDTLAFPDTSPEVANILLDLTKRDTLLLSKGLAETLARTLKPHTLLIEKPIRSANFAVLRTPDVPAILVELGYLSNKKDTRLLESPRYLKTLCSGIVEAVEEFCARELTVNH